jgi:L-seryl-tRNA(Ser) seleniumtransferase
MTTEDVRRRLRELPAIDELLGSPAVAPLAASLPRPLLLAVLRAAVEGARQRLLRGEEQGFGEGDLQAALRARVTPNLRRVVNATGVVLHTNLGRAPLAERAVSRIAEAAGYCNLELDLATGARGKRSDPLRALLVELTGAEDALVVNNCAAAVLLTLTALAQGREAIVSRGELVEIGGGFRVPDVMRQAGCALVEVGTTNRTRRRDYLAACGERTALLVKVHRSNFALVGFTEEASVAELAAVGSERKVPLFVDLGSGALRPFDAPGLPAEPTVAEAVAAGASVVAFSGDKLLGGPQAGILVGAAEVIQRLAAHPLYRAVRVDKLVVGALEATLELYRDGVDREQVPVRAMVLATDQALASRAQALSRALEALEVVHEIRPLEGRVGGGSMPTAVLRSWGVAVPAPNPGPLLDRLREGAPPVVARIVEGALALDVRCLEEQDLELVARRVADAVRVLQ